RNESQKTPASAKATAWQPSFFRCAPKRRLERVTRLELATSSLARRCSTTELHPHLKGTEIMAQRAHSATANSAEWQTGGVMQDSLPLLQHSIILFLPRATNSATSQSTAISCR